MKEILSETKKSFLTFEQYSILIGFLLAILTLVYDIYSDKENIQMLIEMHQEKMMQDEEQHQDIMRVLNEIKETAQNK